MSVAWVFNLDAEDELARGGPHTPTQVTRARVESLLPVLSQLLLPGDEVLWPPGAPPKSKLGRAWCPTPWAVSHLARAGLQPPDAPPAETLRAVNHRRFSHALGEHLEGARFVDTEEELVAALSDTAALGRTSVEGSWLMKRPLGYAGRGRRKISNAQFNAADRTWVDGALRAADGLQVEPFVTRELDCALHGQLSRDGALTLGQPTVAVIDASGTWQSSVLAGDELSAAEREALETEARLTARALTAAGYFGPFGIDAFRWRAPDGSVRFNPRCEVNARYSMGWAVGMNRVPSPLAGRGTG